MNNYDLTEAARLLGAGVTPAHVLARIRRGSLAASQDADGQWRISQASLEQAVAEAGSCGNCSQPASSYLIIKYPRHERLEFSLCEACAQETAASYSRQGGVIEITIFPIQSEAWIKP